MDQVRGRKVQFCATCVFLEHVGDDGAGRSNHYRCRRLGYETSPRYSFHCWTPRPGYAWAAEPTGEDDPGTSADRPAAGRNKPSKDPAAPGETDGAPSGGVPMPELDREQAWNLLCTYTESDRLRKHGLAVEAAMRGYAEAFGEDRDRWGITGLLHDFDYERWPDEHPASGTPILEAHGYPPDVVRAIRAHGDHLGIERVTPMERALYACDELSGFVVAIALVRPDRSLAEVEVKTVQKKLKDKAFARGVNRDEVRRGMEELGVAPEVHIGNILAFLRPIETKLGLGPTP